jgi:hypothetical protein
MEASVSVAAADRIEQEMDVALRILHQAGERGVVFRERPDPGLRSQHVYPLGVSFCESLDRLFRFGLIEFPAPDRIYGRTGTRIHDRALLTESGRAKAKIAASAGPENRRH